MKVTCISKFYDIEAKKERNPDCSFEVSKERAQKLLMIGLVKEASEPTKKQKTSENNDE